MSVGMGGTTMVRPAAGVQLMSAFRMRPTANIKHAVINTGRRCTKHRLLPKSWIAGAAITPSATHTSSLRGFGGVPARRQRQRSTGIRMSSQQELLPVLVFSAFPFVTVKLIAEGPIGAWLQRRLEERKAEFEQTAAAREKERQAAKAKSPWYGPDRPKWLGPLEYTYPLHLSGQYAGDYGFDWLALGATDNSFRRNFNLEILHSRWSMLAALGVVVPEILQMYGNVDFTESVWWRVGYAKLQGEDLDYLGIPGLHVAGAQGVLIIGVCQALLMLGPEYARGVGIKALEPVGIFLPGDENYPGGWLFDPLNLSGDPRAFEDLTVKEMKNGRLSMVAWLGFAMQALVTGKGPVENLVDHVADPVHNNALAYILK